MVKNSFERQGRWDSVGLDCSSCQYFKSPSDWPDKKHEIFCNYHKVSLVVELGKDSYKMGEWFCKNFKDNGKSLQSAVAQFNMIKDILKQGILYCIGKVGEDLKEVNLR